MIHSMHPKLQQWEKETNSVKLVFVKGKSKRIYFSEALKSVTCDVIKINLKRRIASRSWKGNQLLNIKTAVERPILKLELQNFRWSFYFILLLVASLLFRRFL